MHITRQTIIASALALVIGVAAILGIRYVTYSPEHVHYHANFDVYIYGKRELFKSPMYYEEEGGGSCTAEKAITPEERAHMHDNIGDVVHVEDHAVTWGNFFNNLGWVVNDRIIQTPDTLYMADESHPITFIISGREIQDISKEVIRDQDRLLVDFGATSDAEVQKEFKSVPSTATKYDQGKDPIACMSNAKPTATERLKHLL